jgi:hypothetical protein
MPTARGNSFFWSAPYSPLTSGAAPFSDGGGLAIITPLFDLTGSDIADEPGEGEGVVRALESPIFGCAALSLPARKRPGRRVVAHDPNMRPTDAAFQGRQDG